MAVHEIEGRYNYEKPRQMITKDSLEKGKQAAMEGQPIRTVRAIYTNGESEHRIDEDLRRIALSYIALIKRRYPEDWRKMVAEMNTAKAA